MNHYFVLLDFVQNFGTKNLSSGSKNLARLSSQILEYLVRDLNILKDLRGPKPRSSKKRPAEVVSSCPGRLGLNGAYLKPAHQDWESCHGS